MKKWIPFLLKASTIVILLSSVLPSLFPNSWIIDILSNFKLQIIVVSILLFSVNLFSYKDKIIGVVLLVLTIWNTSFVANLYYPSQLGRINKLRGHTIASINLLSSNDQSKRVIDFITTNDPDILILLEFNQKWQQELTTTLSTYKFQKTEVRNDNFGIGYFSKIESKTSVLNFDSTRIPSIKAELSIYEKPLTIIATHPLPPVGQQRFESRNAHLKTIAKRRNQFSENLILIGDLNTSSFSRHFINLIEETELRDSRNGFGILPTWPSSISLLQTTLDHFLISDKVRVIQRRADNDIGSDHLPIFMEFRIEN